jgi:hypothetical protein
MPLRFSHIVNPYGIDGKLDAVQQLTISMLEKASKNTSSVVKLLSAQYSEERNLVPASLEKTADLQSGLQSVSGNNKLPKLPLLSEILDRAQNSDCDYVIWSNMDIIPVPQFYDGVAAILESEKCDAVLINRRRVGKELINTPELLFNETGRPHPGYDCFVMRKELIRKLSLGNICVGAPGVGFMLAHNLFLHAEKCVVLANKHLTLHIGMEIVQDWKGVEVADFQKSEIKKFIAAERKNFRIEKFPGYNLPFFSRHKKWFLNPLFHYPMMFSMDIKKLFDGRKIIKSTEGDSNWQEWKSTRINFDE